MVAHNEGMNLATTILIRATFDAYVWPNVCTCCGSSDVSEGEYGTGKVTCGECGRVDLPDSPDYPDESHGWVDPCNPWGSFEQDVDDTSAEPASIELPIMEAVEFLIDFPGGVWHHREAESETVDYRTGRIKSVTAHYDAPDDALDVVALAFDLLNR